MDTMATRSKTEVYLLGSKTTDITGSKLPSIRQSLGLFIQRHTEMKETRRDAAAFVIQRVFAFWKKARIPTRAVQHCQQKLDDLFEEWRLLKENKARQSTTQKAREAKFCEKLDSLFDIAHGGALNMITIPEDRDFLLAQREVSRRGCMAGVDLSLHRKEKRRAERLLQEEERHRRALNSQEMTISTVILESSDSSPAGSETNDNNLEYDAGTPSTSRHEPHRKRGRKSVITESMTSALDRTNLSDRRAMMIVTETAGCIKLQCTLLASSLQPRWVAVLQFTVCHQTLTKQLLTPTA